MIALYLIPETPLEGPASACAEIRLLRPYTHRSMSQDLAVSIGNWLPTEPIHAVVLQRGGPIGSTIGDIVALVSRIRARGARLIYDLDDDLLAPHPTASIDRVIEDRRAKIRYLLREADLVTVCTSALAERVRRHNPNVVVWKNALDEALVPPLKDTPSKAQFGYVGTNSHLQDLMAIVNQLATSIARSDGRPGFEICGISEDERVSALLSDRFEVRLRRVQPQYEGFHRMLAVESCWAVGLAPLLPGLFNDAKSDIKALDYAAAGIPAVVSDAPAYAKLENGKTVLRAPISEFGETAFALLRDHDRRRQIAAAAHEELLNTRVLRVRARELLTIVKQVLDRAPFQRSVGL